jgi:hypothetical protein
MSLQRLLKKKKLVLHHPRILQEKQAACEDHLWLQLRRRSLEYITDTYQLIHCPDDHCNLASLALGLEESARISVEDWMSLWGSCKIFLVLLKQRKEARKMARKFFQAGLRIPPRLHDFSCKILPSSDLPSSKIFAELCCKFSGVKARDYYQLLLLLWLQPASRDTMWLESAAVARLL